MHDRLLSLVRDGLSVFRVDEARLRALRPDVIVTQDQCAVCAATPSDVEGAVRSVLDPPPDLLTLTGTDLQGVWTDFARVADGLGVGERADRVVSRCRSRIERTASRAGLADRRPTVALVEWLDPLMGAGNWVPEIVRLAGGRASFGVAGAHSPWIGADDLMAADPDLVVAIPCGLALPRGLPEARDVFGRPPLSGLRAVREGRLYAADGHAFFNRPGPRLVESAAILAEILHPDLFPPAWEGAAWVHVAGHP